MQAIGVNSVCRRLAAATGLLLILMATAAGADPLDADAATAAASQPLFEDAQASELDVSVGASKDSASAVENPVQRVDDAGAFLGQLVTRYFESYN
jgi:hypothetical protein